MNIFRLSIANLKANLLSTVLSLMLLSLGIGMVSFVIVVSDSITDRFSRDIKGIDMVVGAKGSPLQLILSAIYQIDSTTGNIPLSEAEKLKKNPLVKFTIPLAYGDSYQGFRIVGTEVSYLQQFGVTMAEGRPWETGLEVVVGHDVAAALNLNLGDHFHGTHGTTNDGHVHEEDAYTVVGIGSRSGSVADRLILTPIESVWQMHAHEEHHHEEDGHHHEEEEKEITAMLVKFKSPMGIMQIPRWVNENTSMQAALPAIEVNRLYGLMGVGFTTLRVIGIAIMIIAGMSVFISLLNSLKDRRFELALMRSLGASPFKLFSLIILESTALSFFGYVIGIVVGRIGLFLISNMSEEQFKMAIDMNTIYPIEALLFPFAMGVGIVAALIPAIMAYRTDLSSTLRNE